jgi:AraC family transcriptional regulator
MKKQDKLLIKNMVCQRCIMTIETILHKLEIPFSKISLGEAELSKEINGNQLKELDLELKKVGFALIETRVNKIVDDIKQLVLAYTTDQSDDRKRKLSAYITQHLHYDYSYLSDLFSSIEGITIEQFFIVQRIEKVKELIVYEELSLTEIAYQTGFSSVHHLSSQFKKVTGLTPSHFKKIGAEKRNPIG